MTSVEARRKTLAEVMVQEGVTTCQAAACQADSGAQFAEKLGLGEHWPPERVETCRRRVQRTPRSVCPRGKSSPHAQVPCSEAPCHAASDAHVRAHCQEAEVRSCTCGLTACGKRRAAEAGQGHPAGVKSPRDNEAMVNTAAIL